MFILNCFKNRSIKDILKGYEKDVLSSIVDVIPLYKGKYLYNYNFS